MLFHADIVICDKALIEEGQEAPSPVLYGKVKVT